MNRTGKCIKMIMLLKKNKMMTAKEMSQLLDTNPRNIREYRKELEEAGFRFKITSGYNGGYELLNPDIYE